MIHPDNKYKSAWDALVILATVFAAIQIPLMLALDLPQTGLLYVLDWITTVVFLTDVALNFNTSVIIEGQAVTDRRRVARHYLSGWFLIDFISAIPFDTLFVGTVFTDPSRALRLLRLLRLFRLARIAQFMQKIARANIINISVLRMMFLAFWVVMVAHWAATGWIVVGFGASGMDPADGLNPADHLNFYLRSLYWAITTITTIGYGDISPALENNGQLIYTMFLQAGGAAMYGYIIGNIASLLANVDIARAQYLEKMERINTFMRFRQIPDDLQDNVRNYYTYLWESRRGYDEGQVIHELPSSLQMQIQLFLNRDIIEKVPIFKGAQEDLIRQLVIHLQPVVYTPGDFIFRKGDVGTEMFFISRGVVEVVSEDGKQVYATLREGNFFGEIALLLSQPRTASVRALDYCDLYMLDQTTFNGVLENYPDFSRHVRELARLRQQELGEQSPPIDDDEPQSPPARVRNLNLSEVANGAIQLTWAETRGAAIYQVMRSEGETDPHWEVLNACLLQPRYQDPAPQRGARYRVRAMNEAGEGAWSETVSRSL